MNEVLFIYSPITLVLSLVAIVLAATFSTMLAKKSVSHSFPLPYANWSLPLFSGTFSALSELSFSVENILESADKSYLASRH